MCAFVIRFVGKLCSNFSDFDYSCGDLNERALQENLKFQTHFYIFCEVILHLTIKSTLIFS